MLNQKMVQNENVQNLRKEVKTVFCSETFDSRAFSCTSLEKSEIKFLPNFTKFSKLFDL
jgi:hypothetical protein